MFFALFKTNTSIMSQVVKSVNAVKHSNNGFPQTQPRSHLLFSMNSLWKKKVLHPWLRIQSFPFLLCVSFFSNHFLESQQSSPVKAVCSTHHQHLYRSPAIEWWFVPVLRQNYPLPLSQYRLLPLSGAIPRADTKKEEENMGVGERMKEFQPTNVWIADEIDRQFGMQLSLSVTETLSCLTPVWWSQVAVGGECCQRTAFHWGNPINITKLLWV